jgi:hypothetical protein
MNRKDPLERWLFERNPRMPARIVADVKRQVIASLGRLAEFLDSPPDKRPKSMAETGRYRTGGVILNLSPADLARAQELYRRVYETSGTGRHIVQERLLELISSCEDTASIPFWLEILDFSRPRDLLAESRRTTALASLAMLVIRHNAPEASDALRQATRHADPEIRALAVHYLGRAYLEAERPVPPEVLADLSEIAVQDPAFGPRFQVRSILRVAGSPVPLDNPGGAYAFKVKFTWVKEICRTIELRSEQTLDDLHFAIQRAIGWDADHLYSFYMNGRLEDRRYAFACPVEDDRPPWTDKAVIGELGLTLKHKFLYYFDYGDSHEFEVEVVGIYPQAEPGEYPRVVDSRGEAPSQYGW